VRSSPAYAVSSLELPAVTAADKACGLLVMLAAAFVAWTGLRAEAGVSLVALAVVVGVLALVSVLRGWHRARRVAARTLEAHADGSIWLHQAGQGPVAVTVGPGTRLLGPSVFLDLRVANAQSPGRVQCWISFLDAPRHVLRRWSVVLPRCGRVAGK
jgi:hypothetical protein